MVTLNRTGSSVNQNIQEFIVDKITDISDIPATAPPHSQVLVIEDSSVRIKSEDGSWKII